MNLPFPILAIDYGARRIGLAISDNKGLVAQPLRTIRLLNKATPQRQWEHIVNELNVSIKETQAKSLLIGVPQVFTSSQEKSLKKVLSFVELLKEAINLPTDTYDESFSTKTAQNMLLSTDQHTKKTRKKIDSVASAVFLQEFLNSKKQ